MTDDAALRRQIITLLLGRGAHMTFEDAVADFPDQWMNVFPPSVSYTCWHLLEHMRITQRDILDYIIDPNYVEPTWPDDYWLPRDATTDRAGWDTTIRQFQSDLNAMIELVRDPANDLTAQLSRGHEGHTLLREALILADHNAYHIGELGILRQVMGTWNRSS